MAAVVTVVGENLIRTTGIAPGSGDYTCTFWWRMTAAETDAVIWYNGNDPTTLYTTYVVAHLVVSGGTKVVFHVGLNSFDQASALSSFNVDQWYRLGYVRSGTSHRWYFDGALVSTITADFSTATDPIDQIILFDDGFGAAQPNMEIAYFREWDTALTLPQLLIEWAAQSPVVTSNLWSDATFQTNGDDDSGNNRDYTPTGSTSFVALPTFPGPAGATEILLSTCLSPLSPYTDSQNVWNAGANDVWYKITNDLTQLVGMSEIPVDAHCVFWAHGPLPDSGTSYNPQSNGYFDPEGTALTIGTSYPNCPLPISILQGESVYISCETVRSVGEAELEVVCIAHPATQASDTEPAFLPINEEVFIPSASVFFDYYIERQGFINGFIDPSIEAIREFIPFFLPAEWGDTLANGVKAFIDRDRILPDQPGTSEEYVAFYNLNFTFLTKTIVDRGAISGMLRTQWTAQTFVVLEDLAGAAPLHYYVMLADGSIDSDGDLAITVGSFAMTAHCMTNNENEILVGGNISGGGRIDNCDINGIDRDIWAVAVAGYRVNDILIFPDHTVVALYQSNDFDDPDFFLRRFQSDGTISETFVLSFDVEMASTHARLGYCSDMDYVWFLGHTDPVDLTLIRSNVIRKINISTGSYFYDFTVPNLLDTEIEHPDPPIPLIYVSDTCPIIEVMGMPPPEGGTIIIVEKIVIGGPDGVEFEFTTTGGLTPSTFSLSNGNGLEFTGLAPGTYGITETPMVDYTVTYEITGDQPNDAIEIVGDETITITITNTFTGIPPVNPLSGIYEVIPWKRNDTLWVDFDPEETEDVKIPRPFARTGLIGE